MRSARRLWSCESGTAAIEFALMTPFLVVLLGGVVELGFAMYESMQVNAAVEAGVLYSVANGSALATSFSATSVSGAVTGSGALPSAYTLTATPAPTEFCGCPSASGSVTTLATAPPCSTATCSGSTAATYVQVNASINHLVLLPTSFGLPNTFSATAIVRIQ